MESHTKKSTRIIIWIIAIVMAGGFVLSYFLVILQNENAANQETTELTETAEQTQELPIDPTAHIVNGKVESLEVVDLVSGNGAEVKEGDTITVHYKGTLAQTGAKFESSYDNGEPITFELTGVIEGWQKGLPGMKVGGKRRLVIPASMGYGAQAQGSIPANSDMVFEVELLAVTPKQ